MDAADLPVQTPPGALAAHRPIGLSQGRKRADPHLHDPVRFQRNQVAPQPVAANVVPGAVDRVDDPAAAGNSIATGALLAQQSVVWKSLQNLSGDQLFAFPVGDGHGRRVGLVLGGDAALLVLQREQSRTPAQVPGQLEFLIKHHVGNRSVPGGSQCATARVWYPESWLESTPSNPIDTRRKPASWRIWSPSRTTRFPRPCGRATSR